ncbi:hypothetical protein [Parendozoicomonas sp. Alg238-R29]|uniref:hypothetical protein n=1 Tax=Parendozoicomonas sp. Alg238-R29 TaxID=2993446 RepID=UPI00248E6F92|nr:hypothetical protein [Parendozoicomonas sp. Alg238-R29]
MSKIIFGSGLVAVTVAAAIGFNLSSSESIAPDVIVAVSPEFETMANAPVDLPPSAAGDLQVASPSKGNKLPVKDEPEELALAAEPLYHFDSSAIASLQQTRLYGDSRAPKLVERDWERELPTAEELANPEQYQAYEQRNEEQVQRAFVAATVERIPEIEKAIEEARALGLDEEQLQEGIEKLEKLKAAQQLLIGQLGSEKSDE